MRKKKNLFLFFWYLHSVSSPPKSQFKFSNGFCVARRKFHSQPTRPFASDQWYFSETSWQCHWVIHGRKWKSGCVDRKAGGGNCCKGKWSPRFRYKDPARLAPSYFGHHSPLRVEKCDILIPLQWRCSIRKIDWLSCICMY